jgi:hypothetical protein
VWRGVSVAASLGPAGIKPTEAKKPTVELVLAAEFLIRLPSGLSRRRHSSFAYRRACPGGGVTKQLRPSPAALSSFSSAFQAEEKEERVVCGAAFR